MTGSSPARCPVSMAADGWLVEPSSNCNRPLVWESDGPCETCGHPDVDARDDPPTSVHSKISWSRGRPDLTGATVCHWCDDGTPGLDTSEPIHIYKQSYVCPVHGPLPESPPVPEVKS